MTTTIQRRFLVLVSVAAAALVIALHPQAVAGLTGGSGADNGGTAHAPAGGGAGHGK